MNTTHAPAVRTNVAVEVGDSALDGEAGIFTAARVDLAQRWNGYLADPMFTLDEAQRVIAYVNDQAEQHDSETRLSYDATTDTITLVSEEYPDEPESWGGFDVDGQHFYRIGDGWTWASYYPENVAAVVQHAPAGALIAADVTDEAPYFTTVEQFGEQFAGQIWEFSTAAGKFVALGSGARFDTRDEARAWALTFTASADGPLGARTVAVYEV